MVATAVCCALLATAAPAWGQAADRPSDYAVWSVRLRSAYLRRDIDDMILSLTMIARIEPTGLRNLGQDFVFFLAREANRPGRSEIGLDLLQALFDAEWKVRYVGEPSWLWRNLTAMLIERGDLESARVVARRIGAPRALIGMRADRRFDAIVQAEPKRFDVNAASLAEIAALRAMVERWSDAMEPSVLLADALMTANRCAEALEVLDAVRSYAASLEAEEKPYVDGGQYFIWILDQRSRALECLGRWDEALTQRVRASVLTEDGEPNVSQAINLASDYVSHGRPRDALATLAKVGPPSEYGSMQMQSVRLEAAVQLDDRRAIGEALEFMRAHRDDAIATFQYALVVADELDEAAEVLIRRLDTPELRLEALEDLQRYADSPSSPVVLPWSGRTRALYRRPDVQAAIERVGRIETYESIQR